VIPLSRLLTDPRAGATGVAFGRAGDRTTAELRSDVAALAARLGPLAPDRVLLHCDDVYAFAVGLLAVVRVGACAVLPPSRQPGALRALVPGVAALVLDGDSDADTFLGRPCLHPLEAPPAPAVAAPLDRDAACVELFTSGTTGAGRSCTKRLRHLEDEVAMLEDAFGAGIGRDARILATTSPQHLYGLLVRVLWPLATGRSFLRTPLLHATELAPLFASAAPFALVTTPVPLRHLVERADLRVDAGTCRAVYSSGGPLPAPVAARAREVFGAPPYEIYGSTETGGVALRRQAHGDEPWRPLAGVSVAAAPEGRLAVTSPFVSEGEALPDGRARFVLGDRALFGADGSFELRGRADRVVKIGEKRLALAVIEARLAEHPAVAEAAVVPLGQLGGETRVGAVVVLTEAGRAILAAGGRRALAKALGEHLAGDFDRVLLPRAWRVVDALPRDAQGKTPALQLQALFQDGEPAAPSDAAEAGRR
jgi:acyl-coenzyme A synthetase/AMP-(fatty) acid ligase